MAEGACLTDRKSKDLQDKQQGGRKGLVGVRHFHAGRWTGLGQQGLGTGTEAWLLYKKPVRASKEENIK